MPRIGLHVSDHTARFCRLSEAGDGAHVVALGEAALPEGTLVGGAVRSPAVLALAIRTWLSSPAGRPFRNRPCVVALPAAQSFIRLVTLPQLPAHEIGLAMRWEVEGLMPLAAGELFYGCHLLPAGDRSAARQAVVTAVPRSITAGYRRAFDLAGMRQIGFEFEPHALARSLAPRAAASPVAIAALGRLATQVTIAHRGLVYVAASLPIGWPGGTPAEPLGEHLAAELRHMLWSWCDHPAAKGMEQKDVSTVYLATDGDSPGLLRFLAASLGRPVLPADPFVNICLAAGHVPPVPRHEAPGYATAIGLALGGSA